MFDKKNVKNLYALTPLQEGILFHSLMDEEGATYFEQARFNVHGPLDIPLLEKAWNELIKRHDILRTIFVMKNVPQPLQVVLKKRELKIDVIDLTPLPSDGQEREIQSFRERDQKRPFNLSQDLLIRISLFQRAPEFHTLVWSFHHIIMDGWSVSVLYEELATIYGALVQGNPIALPQPIQFNTYIRWLKKRKDDEAKAYWKTYLEGYGAPSTLPRRSPSGTLHSTDTIRRNVAMDPVTSRGLTELALNREVTVNTLFQAMWGVIMGAYNQRRDVVFGITVSGRPTDIQGIERMVGLFINAIPVRVRFEPGDPFHHMLKRLQSEAAQGRDFHYASLADIQAETPLRHHLFDQLLVFENYPDPSDVLGAHGMGLSLSDFDQFEQTNYNVTIEVFPGDPLAYDILYNPDLFDESIIESIPRHLKKVADAILSDDTIAVGEIPVLTPAEKSIYHTQSLSSTEADNASLHDSEVPTPSPLRRVTTRFAPPQKESEKALVAIWEEVLEQKTIGIDDNFFEIGGHSLRATRIISRIHKSLGVEIKLQEFFQHPDIRSLARLVDAKKGDLKRENASENASTYTPIPRVPPAADYALSHAQRRLWILDQMEDAFTAYNQSTGVLFQGPLDLECLRKAMEEVMARHESLRTVFIDREGEPRQKILSHMDVPLLTHDLSHLPHPERDAKKMAEALPLTPFDLATGPLWNVTLLHLGPNRHLLFINMHHIICDGWSVVILEKDVLTRYRQRLERSPHEGLPPLPPLPIQYKDFALWQNHRLTANELTSHKTYWHEQLQGELPILNLPTDFPRPRVRTYNGAVIEHAFSNAQTAALTRLCRRHHASLFMGLITLIKILIYRYTGQTDLIIGTPVAGRDHTDLENQIGFFVNTLALRNEIVPEKGFIPLLLAVSDTVTQAFDHQIYPFDRLVDELDVLRDVGRSPIFDVMVVLQNNMGISVDLPELELSSFNYDQKQSQFDLTFIFSQPDDDSEDLSLMINYNTDLFLPSTVKRVADHLTVLLTNALNTPETPISRLPLLTSDEMERLSSGFNTRTKPFPDKETLATLFETQVEKSPDQIAVIYHDQNLTYRTLNLAANILGYHLQNRCGVQPGAPVAVLMDRSALVPIALLGVLKAGGTYLPLDPQTPVKRLQFILEDSLTNTIVSDPSHLAMAHELGCPSVIDINTVMDLHELLMPSTSHTKTEPSQKKSPIDNGHVRSADLTKNDNPKTCKGRDFHINPPAACTPTDLAYIIYTSGSTGVPKGVMVEHRGFINMILDQIDGFGITPEDRVLQFATLMFDASMSEIFMALLKGAAVVMIDRDDIEDTKRFTDYLTRHRVTVATLPPVYLRMLDQDPLPTLKVIITAGEPAIVDDALFYSQSKRYFNAYGPTETSVCTAFHQVDPKRDYGRIIPVGRPVTNNAVFIVDNHLNLQPVGIPGEICFSGVGLARGYLNRPELTAERFLPHPFQPDGRLYRIGDMGRWLPDGEIEFLGRLDDQVKLRGFRIEPGEIASSLKQFPGIEDALVMVWHEKKERGQGGSNHLIAYIVTDTPPDTMAIRSHLANHLPGYMIPSLYIPMNAFPMTINGKIDQRALPDPKEAMGNSLQNQRPNHHTLSSQPTPEEAIFQSVWCTLFGMSKITQQDDFFVLGGDSIKAIRMVALLREQGIVIRVKDIFQWPTLRDLVKNRAQNHHDDKMASNKAHHKKDPPFVGRVPQTPIYRWFFSHFKAGASHFNHVDLFYSADPIDPQALLAAVKAITRHHDMLRLCCLHPEKNHHHQGIQLTIKAPSHHQDEESSGVTCFDFRDLPLDKAKQSLTQTAIQAQSAMNLFHPPLFQAILFKLMDGDRLLLIMHHLLGDAVSWRILLEDLESAYRQHLQGAEIQLPQKTDPFPIWADALTQYAKGNAIQEEKIFWEEMIGRPTGALPWDFEPSPATMKEVVTKELEWDPSETEALRHTGRRLNVGLDRILVTALAHTYRAEHGDEATLISLESHGRAELFDTIDVTRTIGWFTALFPVVIHAPKRGDLIQGIATNDRMLKSIPNQGIGWGVLKYLSGNSDPLISKIENVTPAINLNYLGEFDGYGKTLFQLASEETGPRFDPETPILHHIEINAAIVQNQLHVVWHFNGKRFTLQRIARMIQTFSSYLEMCTK